MSQACNIHWEQLGLTEEQRRLVDSQIKSYIESDTALKEAITERNALRDKLNDVVLTKRERTEVFKGDRKAIEDEIKAKKARIDELAKDDASKEDIKKMREEARTEAAKSREKHRAKRDEELNKLREDAKTLRDYLKKNTETQKSIRNAKASVTNRVTRAWKRDNRVAMNRANLEQELDAGRINIMDALDQQSESPLNVHVMKEQFEDRLTDGVDGNLLNEANQADLNDPNVKEFIKQVRDQVNTVTSGEGALDKHGFTHENEHPVQVSKDVIMPKLFGKMLLKGKPNQEAIYELKGLILKHIGEDKFNEHIEHGYKNENVPTIDRALEDYAKAHVEGTPPKILNGRIEFKSFEDAAKFNQHYSNQTFAGIYAGHLSSVAKRLTSDRLGGLFKPQALDATLKKYAGKNYKKAEAYAKLMFGSPTQSTIADYRMRKILDSTTGALVLARAVRLATASIADGARNEFMFAFKYGARDNALHSAMSIPYIFFKGIAPTIKHAARLPKSFTEAGSEEYNQLRQFTHVFGETISHMNRETGEMLRPVGGKLSPSNFFNYLSGKLGQSMENMDRALLVESAIRHGELLLKHKGTAIENMPEGLKQELKMFGFTDADMKKVTDKLSDDETKTLSSNDFSGDLANKVAGFVYRNKINTMVGENIVPNIDMFKRNYPKLGKVASMFWNYTIKTLYSVNRTAIKYRGAKALPLAYAQMAATGFFGNMMYSYLANGTMTGNYNLNDYMNNIDNYMDALGGVMSHPAGVSSSIFSHPSSLVWQINPMVTLGLQSAGALNQAGRVLFGDGDTEKLVTHLAKVEANITPIAGGFGGTRDQLAAINRAVLE